MTPLYKDEKQGGLENPDEAKQSSATKSLPRVPSKRTKQLMEAMGWEFHDTVIDLVATNPDTTTAAVKSAPVSPQNKELDTTALNDIKYLVYNLVDHYQNDHPDPDQTQECKFAIETIDELNQVFEAWNKATVIEAQNKIADELLPDNSMVLAYMDETTAKASGLNYISRASLQNEQEEQ